MTANHLAHESSPYLKQHMHNPVDWYPWGQEALDKAKREDKPIFLSIGYSSCHWCHVMAHESFEDSETAAYLNEHFVCIKVDREERPDLDALYMRSVMFMSGSGGWPLSVFLTSDLKPFYGGTYFPMESRWGMPSFRQVLERVAAVYESNRSEVDGSGNQILRAVAESFAGPGPSGLPGLEAADKAKGAIMGRFDETAGGFGAGPKFPQPPLLHFLLDQAVLRSDQDLMDKVVFTLKRMEAGGVRDQVGGGFHRYSVDGEWLVPHFEKMLYDNAQLASLYFWAYDLTSDGAFRRVGEDILNDMAASMASPGGGFVAAIDADSEGEEGKFYLWTPEEIESVLGEREGKLVGSLFGLSIGGSPEHMILHRVKRWSDAARDEGQNEEEFVRRVRTDLDSLRRAREKRVHPGVDSKVLTDWNALSAEAFLDGFMATGDKPMLTAAIKTLDCIWDRCWDGEVLFHVWDGRKAKVPGFLSDHAYLAAAEWRAFEADGDPVHLERVNRLLELIRARFVDGSSGRLCDAVASEGGPLIPVRDVDDGVLPSPLAIYARVLWRWERLTDSEQPRSQLEELLRLEGGALKASPGAQPLLACLAALRSLPPVEVVVAAHDLSRAAPLLWAARRNHLPGLLVLPLLGDRLSEKQAATMSLFEGRRNEKGEAAYLCMGGSCQLPVSDPDALNRSLGKAIREVLAKVSDPT